MCDEEAAAVPGIRCMVSPRTAGAGEGAESDTSARSDAGGDAAAAAAANLVSTGTSGKKSCASRGTGVVFSVVEATAAGGLAKRAVSLSVSPAGTSGASPDLCAWRPKTIPPSTATTREEDGIACSSAIKERSSA